MAGSTALSLIQELGSRMGDYADGTVTSVATTNFYLDDNTRVEPDNALRFGWLTYTGTGAPTNTGLERRITSYDGTVNVGRIGLGNGNAGSGLAANAFTGDSYEVHMRWSRKRKLAALNAAIRRLPQDFWRRIIDETTTTAANTWRYALPAGITQVLDVQLQNSLNFSTFPYSRLRGWSETEAVSTTGVVTRYLQFNSLPPSGRILRIIGKGFQPLLVADTDVLSVGQDDYDQRLVEYVLGYAECQLWLMGADGAPVEQAGRSLEMVKMDLQLVNEMKPSLVMPQMPLEIETPYTGDGTLQPYGWGDNPAYLAALRTPQ